jgi:hypothetical protein
MKKGLYKLIFTFVLIVSPVSIILSQNLERLAYNNPGLIVDLGVGLWAWPLPMDYNDNGLTDLVVICTDVPYSGVYYFENSGVIDNKTHLPVYKPAVRLGKAENNVSISYIEGKPFITTPGKWYPDFKSSGFEKPVDFPAPTAKEIHPAEGNIRANQWKVVDYDSNGVNDLIVGIGFWGEYGWDNAYDSNGQWTNGPLHGYIYLLKNKGTNDSPIYESPIRLEDTDGAPIDVFGRPSPNFVDFNGDHKPDIICGEFRDGFTFFENVGTLQSPLFKPGVPLTHGDKKILMDLCMITPVAYDYNEDGWMDLIVGDEDGRVAIVEHTGKVIDGVPLFLTPRYFRQYAAEVKFGALATPVGFDWDGDGLDDILAGNTAGQIAFIKNLGGSPVKWDAPMLLEANGEVIHIQAGPSGSIQGPAEAKWGYTTLSVADWDHDGLPDLIVNSIWGKIIWYENMGTRTKPLLAAAKPIEVEWEGKAPKPEWNWWNPEGKALVTQWRTTPVATDWTGDGLTDLVMLDHEGFLALYRREKRGDKLVLMPGERVFRMEGEESPLRLNDGTAGKSGRRKISVVDFDGDGRRDIILNSQNATFYRNMGSKNGITRFKDMGLMDERKLAGHSSSPTMIKFSKESVPALLIGAEDGYFYYKPTHK